MLSVSSFYQTQSIKEFEPEDKELAAIAVASETKNKQPCRRRQLTPYPGKKKSIHQEESSSRLKTIPEEN
jgi:hypothetical protein